jgi:hypothetical protein
MSADAVTREELHHRSIDLRFFSRSDGLFEVEGFLVDTKTHAFRRLLAEKDAPPGQRLHDITVRLVLDSEHKIHAADAEMRATPFNICPGAAGALQSLVGLPPLCCKALPRSGWPQSTILITSRSAGPGWTAATRSRQNGRWWLACCHTRSTPNRSRPDQTLRLLSQRLCGHFEASSNRAG